ncbi:MAG: TlpA family protein disulfide reductase [Pseudomonadales bacterium]|nr:TlpA family protein disulfide reductase [Pseudomonadales bacterium]
MHKPSTTLLLRLTRALMISASLLTSLITMASEAPPFSLPDSTGKQISLAQQQGKVVYLDFWASWCGPCRQSFPWMNEMRQKYQSRGLEIIAVNLDSKREDADKFLSKIPAEFTVLYESSGATPTAYGVKGMPTSFLIDAKGQILSQHAGFNSAHKDELEAAIQQALEKQQ